MSADVRYDPPPPPALLFDLDGTLVDNVYQHVIAWRQALHEAGHDVPVWRIHRRIGMSGGLLVDALTQEVGTALGGDDIDALQARHGELYEEQRASVRPLPGAERLLARLTEWKVTWGIASSANPDDVGPVLERLGVPDAPLVTRGDVAHAKPDPDPWLAGAALLGVEPYTVTVVGDSVWDLMAARRAKALGVGLLTGGYGREELERAGAYRVYEDPADLSGHLHELGVRPPG
jgi:HAD superfamily hydrolase (TIGR01549 family)